MRQPTYVQFKYKHNTKLAFIADVVMSKGKRYIGIRYCLDCTQYETALGLFYDIPERAEIKKKTDIVWARHGLSAHACRKPDTIEVPKFTPVKEWQNKYD